MLFRHTIVMARNFLTKFNMHLRIIDTHTRNLALTLFYYYGLLTVTDNLCCVGRSTKFLLEQGSIHNTITRLHRIYDGHHPFKSLGFHKNAAIENLRYLSALSKIQYAFSDFIII